MSYPPRERVSRNPRLGSVPYVAGQGLYAFGSAPQAMAFIQSIFPYASPASIYGDTTPFQGEQPFLVASVTPVTPAVSSGGGGGGGSPSGGGIDYSQPQGGGIQGGSLAV